MNPANPSGSDRPRRWARLLGTGAAVASLIAVAMVGHEWFNVLAPPEWHRRANIAYLNALLVAYLSAVGAAAIGAAILTTVLLLRRPRSGRPRIAKALLLCVSCLLSFAMGEGLAASWAAWLHRSPDLVKSAPPPRADEPADPLLGKGHDGDPAEGPDARRRPLKLLVLGESSARGEPYQDWLSVGQILAWQLEKALPGLSVEVDMQAEPGVSLEVMHQKLARVDYRPDVLVLFAGHNEFQYRYRWNRDVVYYDFERESRRPPSPVDLMLRHSPICRLIVESLERQRIPVAPRKVVTREVVDRPAYTAAEKAGLVADFRRRLESIASYCERIGTIAVFVCPASNDRDFDPSRSVLLPDVTPERIAAFEREFLRAKESVASDPDEARRLLRGLLDEQPVYAEGHYWYARLLEAEGSWEAARRHYFKAREYDAMPMRCPEAFREQYREVAREHAGVVLVDSEAVLLPSTSHGILGDHQFHDAHHPSLVSYVALAQDALDQIAGRGLLGWGEGSPAPRIDAEETASHFGLDPQSWSVVMERSQSFYERTAYMRYDPSERLRKAQIYAEAARRIAEGLAPEETGVPGVGCRPTESPGREEDLSASGSAPAQFGG